MARAACPLLVTRPLAISCCEIRVAGDGEADSTRGSTLLLIEGRQGGDADHFPGEIDEGAATVTRIDGRRGLYGRGKVDAVPLAHRAAVVAHDTFGDRTGQPERAANGEDDASRSEGGRVSESGRWDIKGRGGSDHRQVIGRVGANQGGGYRPPGDGLDLKFGGRPHHVIIGDDVASAVKNDPGPEPLVRGYFHYLGAHPGHEVDKRLLQRSQVCCAALCRQRG
jgi:hypothetical protein